MLKNLTVLDGALTDETENHWALGFITQCANFLIVFFVERLIIRYQCLVDKT